jgi:hypothetical protein
VAIANGRITFRWRDYAHEHQTRTMTLEANEFLRRFLLHVLPASFVRIRYFGLLANRHRSQLLALCRSLNDHPEQLHEPAYVLIVRSLNQAFPCKKK